jgi:transcriptional regulator with XRE-family HTH domain
MNSEDISSKDTLREFVHSHAKKRGVTFRQIGAALGMKSAYFSDILTGRKKRSTQFLNALAEYLDVPRVDVYQAAGLLEVSEYESLRAKIDSLLTNEPTVRQALDMLVGLERDDMLRLASWIIIKAVELRQLTTEYPQLPEDDELAAFPTNSKLPPPAFVNMIYQIISQYFRIGSKGQLLPKMSRREIEEYDGLEDDEFADEEFDDGDE